jgi:hypothetical protein
MGTTPIYSFPFPDDTDLVIQAPQQFENLADAVELSLSTVETASKNASNLTSGTVPFARVPRGVSPAFASSGSNTVAISFDVERVITRSATGTVTFTGSSYTTGVSASVRIVAGGANRSLVFPAGWRFVSFKPTTLAANKVGVLAVTSFGTSEGDCVAAWAAEF